MLRYALTVFLSAFLLFQVQLVIGKYILPWFGGGPAIWTACMLFFQVVLLGGYLYAHLISIGLKVKYQGVLHLILLAGSLSALPIAPNEQWKPQPGGFPVSQILLLLLVCVGAPYFLLSSTGPLMQRWFSRSFPGRSPYRLYALSNFGSMIALFCYPVVIEPILRLRSQVTIWSWMYAVYVALAVWCSLLVMKLQDEPANPMAVGEASAAGNPIMETSANTEAIRPGVGRMLLWLGLAAAGSALMLATTNQLCINVGVVPFLWVLPLSLYLLSFVICFDNPRWYDRRVFGLLMCLTVPLACWLLSQGLEKSVPVRVAIFSAVMFACCMTCHGEMVRSRPHARHLTLFYLLVSAGGALGGVLVAIASPALFAGLWEFHVTLAGACLLTVTAWCVNRAWRVASSTVFWIWAVVSILQLWLVAHFILWPHGEKFKPIDLAILSSVCGAIQLAGWLCTAAWEDKPKVLIWLWSGVSLAQLIWTLGFTARRYPEFLSARQYAMLGAGVCALTLAGILLAALGRRKIDDVRTRQILIVSLQCTLVAHLAVMAYFNAIISVKAFGCLLGIYAALNLIGLVSKTISLKIWAERGAWFWAPMLTMLVLLGIKLEERILKDRSTALHISRNFYGMLRVTLEEDQNGSYHSLMHGQIEHGLQYTDDPMRRQATSYYGPRSAVGIAFRLHPSRFTAGPAERSLRVGVVGLGTGTIAAYGQPGDSFHFYEINPDVVKLSGKYFTYLQDSPAKTDVILGDARIVMERELAEGKSQQFDVLAIDAFSSDAIPVHLLTAECADIYRRHLKADGLLLVHISNRYLNLNPVARALARHLGWQAFRIDSDEDDNLAVYGATWIILTANHQFASLAEVREANSPWSDDEPGPLLWTDDFAGLWQIIKR